MQKLLYPCFFRAENVFFEPYRPSFPTPVHKLRSGDGPSEAGNRRHVSRRPREARHRVGRHRQPGGRGEELARSRRREDHDDGQGQRRTREKSPHVCRSFLTRARTSL